VTRWNDEILKVPSTSLPIVAPKMKAVQSYISIVRVESRTDLSNRNPRKKATLVSADLDGRRD